MRILLTAVALAAILVAPVGAQIRADQAAFRGLYKELVETNTTLSAGSCTLAAQRMAARLRAAGFKDADMRMFGVPDHPKEGGYFYGRGSSDDKAQAAIFTDTFVRLKQAGTKLRRPLKLALTCGEAFNGANWLATEHKDWIDAQFALNEGSVGVRDAAGKRVSLGIQAGEKVYQDFLLEARNAGGHSSRPRPDNAIYSLAAALVRIGQYEFPVQFSDTTRAYFTETAKLTGGDAGAAMLRTT